MARFTALQAFFVLGALTIGAAEGAMFDCDKYQTVCVDHGHSPAYADCEGTVAANNGPDYNNMVCRMTHLDFAADIEVYGVYGNATHCPHAEEETTYAPCAAEKLMPAKFDCDKYQAVCVDHGHSPAFADCEGTVAANTGMGLNNMVCRKTHLDFAADIEVYGVYGNATHCPHAEEETTFADCAAEILVAATFDCDKYQTVCVDHGHSPAYTDCEGTVAANTAPGLNGMSCRMTHLNFAADLSVYGPYGNATHCAHAEEDTTFATCAAEVLVAPAKFDCDLYQTVCVDHGHSPAYADCEGTVAANMDTNNMACRRTHLNFAADVEVYGVYGNATHCPHAEEETTFATCAAEILAAPASSTPSSASYSTVTSFAALMSLIAAAAQM